MPETLAELYESIIDDELPPLEDGRPGWSNRDPEDDDDDDGWPDEDEDRR